MNTGDVLSKRVHSNPLGPMHHAPCTTHKLIRTHCVGFDLGMVLQGCLPGMHAEVEVVITYADPPTSCFPSSDPAPRGGLTFAHS